MKKEPKKKAASNLETEIEARTENEAQDALPLDMPESLPVFVAAGALLLPGAVLTVSATTDDECALIDHALANGRIIAVFQPREKKGLGTADELFSVGGVGRITTFSEMEDGAYLIGITGLGRCRLRQHWTGPNDVPLIEPDWTPFMMDFTEDEGEPPATSIDREKIFAALTKLSGVDEFIPDVRSLQQTRDEVLIAVLAMACPFSIAEKQALLESPTLTDRATLLLRLLEMPIHLYDGRERRH